MTVSGLRLVSAWRDGGPGGQPASGPGGGSATFRAPNTVWVQSGLPLRAEFTARLHEAAATLADADFAGAPEAARTLINRAIAEQTEQAGTTGLLPPRRRQPTDQAGARQCGVPEGGVDASRSPRARRPTLRSTRAARTIRA